MRRFAWAALVCAACRSAPTTAVRAPTRDEGASAVLAQRIDALTQQLAPRGVRGDGVIAHGFITHGTQVTTPVDLAEGECVSLVAMASAGVRDLDAHLFDPSGELVVEDIETDAHPTVQLCASAPRRVYHVMEAYEGQGAWVVARFRSDRAGFDALASAVGGRPAAAAGGPRGRSDIERRINEARESVAPRGFAPSGDATRLDFAASGTMQVPLAVTPDRCYTLVALGVGDVTDLDVQVRDVDGEVMARDVRSARDAQVQFCPRSAATLAVEVRASGAGDAVLQAFAADAASVGGANTLWLGERAPWSEGAASLSRMREVFARRLQEAGFRLAAAQPEARPWAPGEVKEQAVTVDAGRCLAVAVLGGSGLARVSADLYDRDGNRVASGVGQGPWSTVVRCATARESLTLRSAAEVGAGDGAMVLAELAAPPAWAGDADRGAVALTLASLLAAPDGWTVSGAPERVRLGGGALRPRAVERPSGRCVRVAAVSAHGAVSLQMRGPRGDAWATRTGDGAVALERCGDPVERVRFDARAEPSTAPEGDGFWIQWSRDARETSPTP